MGASSLNPQFIQPLIPGFLESFSVPVAFLKHLELDPKGQKVELTTEYEPQRRWVVSVHGGRHFKDGWKDFCVHYNLKVGDFVVFILKTHCLFQVIVFDPTTACERHFTPLKSAPRTRGSQRMMEESSSTCETESSETQGEGASAIPPEQLQNVTCRIKLTAYSFQNTIMLLPKKFVTESSLQNRECEMLIMDEKERRWPVKLNYKKCDGQCYFKRGWKDIQVANCFKPGDVICFQLLKRGKLPILKCHRSKRMVEESSSSYETESSETEGKGASAIPPEQLQNVTCRIKLTAYSLKKAIRHLPRRFVAENGLQNRECEMLIMDEKERRWPVKLNYKNCDGQCYVKRGWKDIQVANCFKPGDVICFQLLKGGKLPILKCHKLKRTGDKLKPASKSTIKKSQGEDVTTVPSVLKQSKYPSFHFHLSTYAVEKSIIFLPMPFLRENDLRSRRCEVMVIDEKGRRWQVKMLCKKCGSKSYFLGGWKDVQVANCFKPGDTVCFELLRAWEMPVFKCYRVGRKEKA